LSEAFLNGRVILHAGDCLDVLATLPENSVDSVVCDPPYHLTSIVKRFANAKSETEPFAENNPSKQFGALSRGFMGKQWDGGDIAFQPDTWRAVMRVLKPGGHLVAFSGTRTYHRMACAIEDAGFEIRDCLQWLYGSGFPKSHDVSKGIDKAAGAERELVGIVNRTGKDVGTYGAFAGPSPITEPATDSAREWQGWGTALKPSAEIICLGRKPLSERTVASNVLKWGVGALNIDGCRIKTWEQEQPLCASCAAHAGKNGKHPIPETVESIATKNAAPILNGKGKNGQDAINSLGIGCSDGMSVDDTSTSSNTSKSGKIISGQSLTDLKSTIETRTKATIASTICSSCQSEIIGGITSSGSQNGRWPANTLHDGSEEVLAGFPESDSSANSKPAVPYQPNNKNAVYGDGMGGGYHAGFADSGSAARFFYTAKADASDRIGSKHPTVKPVDLMCWLVRLVTPKGGTCLDPFAGTGTTAEAAFREGFSAILIEREEEYQADIRRRMALCLAGPEEKQRAIIKAKGLLDSAGPLFG
jgi:DNA modification methylase